MGAADVVPGVSGGTIAFITGIYDTLLESIRRVNPSLLSLWKAQGANVVWQHINGTFLCSLLLGILTSILLFAKVIAYALVTHPIMVWSFFFGLIIASAVHMLKQIAHWSWKEALSIALGILAAYAMTISNPIHFEFNLLTVFISGTIAICAMILPGISGSFILLLLGMYTGIIDAVKSLELSVLSVFALGCVTGLLSFSHLLSWLLNKHRQITLTFLTGLLIGALGKVWPWREVLSYRTNSSGEQVPMLEKVLMPNQFEMVTGQDPMLSTAIVIMLLGFSLVLGFEYFSKK